MTDSLFFALLKREGLPGPETEVRFHPVRRFRFDYGWRDRKIALEVEGGVWTRGRHTRGAGYTRDMVKYNLAASMGWLVFRVTPDKLCDLETIAMLKQALAKEAA